MFFVFLPLQLFCLFDPLLAHTREAAVSSSNTFTSVFNTKERTQLFPNIIDEWMKFFFLMSDCRSVPEETPTTSFVSMFESA